MSDVTPRLRDRVEFTDPAGRVVRGKVVYIGRDEPRVVVVQPDGTLDERGVYESQLRPAQVGDV